MTAYSKSKIIVCILILPLIVLAAGIFWPTVKVFSKVEWVRAQFVSPDNSANKIWFYDGGIMDRDLFVYAEPKGQRIQFLSSIVWWPDVGFSCAQWTRDGQVFVCSSSVRAMSNAPILTVAFDFSKNKAMSPSWITKTSCDTRPQSEWRKQESIIKGVIADHGGLSDKQIGDDLLRKNEKILWFWQTPP